MLGYLHMNFQLNISKGGESLPLREKEHQKLWTITSPLFWLIWTMAERLIIRWKIDLCPGGLIYSIWHNWRKYLVVDQKRIFVILPKAERGLLKKVYFCRNTERSCFCQKSPLLQKETLSAGKSFLHARLIPNFDSLIIILFLIGAKLSTLSLPTQ